VSDGTEGVPSDWYGKAAASYHLASYYRERLEPGQSSFCRLCQHYSYPTRKGTRQWVSPFFAGTLAGSGISYTLPFPGREMAVQELHKPAIPGQTPPLWQQQAWCDYLGQIVNALLRLCRRLKAKL
jgi:hypothetical protein